MRRRARSNRRQSRRPRPFAFSVLQRAALKCAAVLFRMSLFSEVLDSVVGEKNSDGFLSKSGIEVGILSLAHPRREGSDC